MVQSRLGKGRIGLSQYAISRFNKPPIFPPSISLNNVLFVSSGPVSHRDILTKVKRDWGLSIKYNQTPSSTISHHPLSINKQHSSVLFDAQMSRGIPLKMAALLLGSVWCDFVLMHSAMYMLYIAVGSSIKAYIYHNSRVHTNLCMSIVVYRYTLT